MPKKVLVAEYIHPAGVEMLRAECEVIIGSDISVSALKESIADVDGVVVRVAPMSREVIEAGRNLKVIGKHGVGTDNIDIPFATERRIAVCYTPEANSEGVAEMAFTYMMALARRVRESDIFTRTTDWSGKQMLMASELRDKTLSIVGTGRIGMRLAEMCRLAFGMTVLAYDPYVSAEDMAKRGVTKVESVDELVSRGDFISVHVPLTPATKGILGTRQFELMKKSAYLVNTSRGPVVDEAALIEALRTGQIAGAGLDVFDLEPVNLDNPLLKMENVLCSPHNAAVTNESMERMATHAAACVLAVLKGERPKWLMNPAALA